MNRIIVKPGNVYAIPINGGRFGYAQALESPEFAFFDVSTEDALPALDVIANPVIFRIWVHKSSLKNWVNLGKAPIQESLGKQVPRFKQDLLSGKLSIYINAQEEPASFEEIQGLECAAVWESPHILSRLNDHFFQVTKMPGSQQCSPRKRVNKRMLSDWFSAALQTSRKCAALDQSGIDNGYSPCWGR